MFSCKKSTTVDKETAEIEHVLASSQQLPSTPEEWVQQNIPDIELTNLEDFESQPFEVQQVVFVEASKTKRAEFWSSRIYKVQSQAQISELPLFEGLDSMIQVIMTQDTLQDSQESALDAWINKAITQYGWNEAKAYQFLTCFTPLNQEITMWEYADTGDDAIIVDDDDDNRPRCVCSINFWCEMLQGPYRGMKCNDPYCKPAFGCGFLGMQQCKLRCGPDNNQ